MHYYKRNIGDYAKKAGRLTILQHGVYNLLMDACYDREEFPTREQAIDWIWASSKDEIAAVDFVLGKFFKNENGVFTQSRIQEELENYQEFRKLQSVKGKAGGRPKKTNGKPVESQREAGESLTTNQEPLTTNQEPIKNTPKKTSAICLGTFLENIKQTSDPFFRLNDPIYKYVDDTKIPRDFMQLAWKEFKARFLDSPKKYKDWRRTFRNYVQNNYLKLWYIDEHGEYGLTTAGKQAKMRHGN